MRAGIIKGEKSTDRPGEEQAAVESAVAKLLPGIVLSIAYIGTEQHVFLNGEDVSEPIRTPPASLAASDVAAQKAVRAYLLDTQRNLAAANDSILDGRDIGTVILPQAQVKIFLTAAPEARAERRRLQLQRKGIEEPFEKVLAEVILRDKQDETQTQIAADAILLDTSALTLEESIQAVVSLIESKKP
jgi:cytidylate kinase